MKNKNNKKSVRNNEVLGGAYESATPYDDIYRTQINELPRLLIPLVNEVFGEDFSEQAKVTLFPNEQYHNLMTGGTEKKITDSTFSVEEVLGQTVTFEDIGGKKGRYLVECESNPTNDRMLIRIFEYAAKSGLDRGSEVMDGELIVNIPRSAVIFLRSSKNTKDEMRIVLRTEEGEVGLPVKVVKIADYSLDDIFEKRLFMLLPFYIFNYEKRFAEFEGDKAKINELKETFKSIVSRLREYAPAKPLKDDDISSEPIDELIDAYAIRAIMEYIKKVTENLAKGYPNVRKGVISVMGGKIFASETRQIKEAAELRGERRGERRGIDIGRSLGMTEGMQTGQSLLVKAIQMLKENKSDEEILAANIDERTLELAKVCR